MPIHLKDIQAAFITKQLLLNGACLPRVKHFLKQLKTECLKPTQYPGKNVCRTLKCFIKLSPDVCILRPGIALLQLNVLVRLNPLAYELVNLLHALGSLSLKNNHAWIFFSRAYSTSDVTKKGSIVSPSE